MGDLDHDPGPVPAFMVGAFTAPVLQVLQDVQGIVDDVIGPFSLDVDDETHPAGIVFVGRVIHTLPLRQVPQIFFHCAAPQ